MQEDTEKNSDLYIVVADDDIEDHSQIKKAIKECDLNYIVTSVFNGLQLIDLLLKRDYYKTDTFRKPDAIFLDLRMRVMDGFEVLSQIKEYENLNTIPIYIFTVSDQEKDRKKALALGATAFYTKPRDYKE